MGEQPSGADVFVTEKRLINHTRKDFLANGKNKEQVIKLLSVSLTKNGHQDIICEGEADTQIVGKVIDLHASRKRSPCLTKT